VQPILDSVDHAIESVNSFRDKPIGTLRLAVARSASQILAARGLPPLISPFLAEYPAIRLEIAYHDTDSDIISGRFDAGIRLGHRIERDMTILRLIDDFQVLTVAAPAYVACHPMPSLPRDLHEHDCIRFRTADGSMPPWAFTKGDQQIEVTVEGSLTVNDIDAAFKSALDGVGVAHLPEPIVASHLSEGRLIPMLEDWSRTLPGVFLYHPSRRQTPKPLEVFLRFVEKWRKRTLTGAVA
jgi:DNA-binding transcriptional LysR family regulator